MVTTITKGKLLKGDVIKINYIKKTEDGQTATCEEEYKKAAPLPSLRVALSNLSIHAAILAEFIAVKEVSDIAAPDHPELEKFSVSGFSIAGGEEMEGVILTGQKTLSNGKALIFNTPLSRFADESDNKYAFADDLLESVQTAQLEMKKYLEGSHATDPQLKLDLPE